eukprot:scaffold52738_cov65-Attheya_sp.AAC.2
MIQPEALYTALVGFDHQATVVMIEISLTQFVFPNGILSRNVNRSQASRLSWLPQLMQMKLTLMKKQGAPLSKKSTSETLWFSLPFLQIPSLIVVRGIHVNSSWDRLTPFSAFNTQHKEDGDMPHAKDSLVHIIQLLWAAAHGLVVGTPYLSAKEPCYLDWSSSLHKDSIASPPSIHNMNSSVHDTTMQSITSPLSIQGQTLENMNDLCNEASANKKRVTTNFIQFVLVFF